MQRLFLGLFLVCLGCGRVDLNSESAKQSNNRGLEALNKGEYDKAIADFNEALRLNPTLALAYCNRGEAWRKKGEYDKAIADNNEALRLNPNNARAYNNRGLAWGSKGEYDRAIGDYNEAIRLDPNDAKAYNNRGLALHGKREYDKAITDFNEALRLNPTLAVAYNNRGLAWSSKRDYDKAIADYNQAVAINPKFPLAYSNLAFLYATCPDGKHRDGTKAVENATKAFQLDGGQHWSYAETLAAAYAESGDFEKAKEWEVKSIALAPNERIKQTCRSHLELYKQGKPYRELPKKVEPERRASQDTRIWTAANGKYTVKATFVSSDTTKVKLKKDDGTVITLALDRLSDEDQAWIQKRSKH